MNKFFSCLTFAVAFFSLSGVVYAECTGDCLQYCGPSGSHGYCVDYIQYRLGIKQDGNAGNWIGNINASDVRPTDDGAGRRFFKLVECGLQPFRSD